MLAWMQMATTVMMAAAGLLFVLRIAGRASALERVLALDGAALTLVGFLLLQGDRSGGHYYLDAALVLALLSFVATIALARVAEKRDADD